MSAAGIPDVMMVHHFTSSQAWSPTTTPADDGGVDSIAFVLLHSPLVGPLTWQPVAEVLRERGHDAIAPDLREAVAEIGGYQEAIAQLVKQSMAHMDPGTAPVLVGHSGASLLLPNSAHLVRQPISRLCYVDSDLPHPGETELSQMPPEIARSAPVCRENGMRLRPDGTSPDRTVEIGTCPISRGTRSSAPVVTSRSTLGDWSAI